MKRRDLSRREIMAGGAALAAGASLPRPAVSQGAAARTLRFVPQANVSSLDPIWTTQFVIRNHSALIFDTLMGIDSRFEPKPQMAEGVDVSADRLTYTFRLREGLRFHDNEPVLARDCVASLRRWMVRDVMGQQIRAALAEMAVTDDRSFTIRLNRPYRQLLFALGKTGTNVAFIMPERLASTDPFQQIPEAIGSGPYRFLRGEWVPGSRSAYERFAGYTPRQEAPDWFSGGKVATLERIEWHIMPDPGTAAAALQAGEVDWWEYPLPDLYPVLRRNRQITVEQTDPLGWTGVLRMNHLHAPFNDARARRAVMMAASQPDYMQAIVGQDTALWREMESFFTPRTPLSGSLGRGLMTGPRDMDAARRLLRESGYAGEPIVLIAAMDIGITKAQSEVTADLLRRLGMNVDFVATDWGTVGGRRQRREPPAQGGWHIHHTWFAGSDLINPAAYSGLRTNGRGAWFGWPENENIEGLIQQWFDADGEVAEKAAAEAVDRASLDFVTYVPTGQFFLPQAWRRNITGIQNAPLPIFFGVRKG